MGSDKYKPVLVSQIMQKYRNKRREEKKGFVEKSVDNIKYIYKNITKKIRTIISNETEDHVH